MSNQYYGVILLVDDDTCQFGDYFSDPVVDAYLEVLFILAESLLHKLNDAIILVTHRADTTC